MRKGNNLIEEISPEKTGPIAVTSNNIELISLQQVMVAKSNCP
jgi:hypothetical protein